MKKSFFFLFLNLFALSAAFSQVTIDNYDEWTSDPNGLNSSVNYDSQCEGTMLFTFDYANGVQADYCIVYFDSNNNIVGGERYYWGNNPPSPPHIITTYTSGYQDGPGNLTVDPNFSGAVRAQLTFYVQYTNYSDVFDYYVSF